MEPVGGQFGAQRQGLGELGRAEPAGPGLQGGARHRELAVPVSVGLDHGHDLGGGRDLVQTAGVLGDGLQIDQGACRVWLGPARIGGLLSHGAAGRTRHGPSLPPEPAA